MILIILSVDHFFNLSVIVSVISIVEPINQLLNQLLYTELNYQIILPPKSHLYASKTKAF